MISINEKFNVNYICKRCDVKQKLILGENIFTGNFVTEDNEKISYSFFWCLNCGKMEVVQVDNASTIKLNEKLMRGLVTHELDTKQAKRMKKKLNTKQAVLLKKYSELIMKKHKGV